MEPEYALLIPLFPPDLQLQRSTLVRGVKEEEGVRISFALCFCS